MRARLRRPGADLVAPDAHEPGSAVDRFVADLARELR
ncbi:MAG: hypothetical protein AVDCRST_MAG66-193, partial [uncultured Pseudonocardia sp.]